MLVWWNLCTVRAAAGKIPKPWYKFCLKFAKRQNDEIYQFVNFAFQCRNAGLVKYTYCRYTAVQPTLLEITKRSYNFCDNIAKLQNDDEIYHILRTSHFNTGRNAGLVKYTYCSNCSAANIIWNYQPLVQFLW